jgi:hypothetical protein
MIPFRVSCLRIRWPAVTVPALVLLAMPALAAAQARERTAYVSALDKIGAPVERLAPTDVVVREDGVAREVLRVVRATEPMQIAILVDNSAAAASAIANLRDGLKRFVQAMGKGHEISLVTYADRPTAVTSFSSDPQEIEKGIERLFAQSNSGAYLMDAIQETAEGFIKRESPRPVIAVVGTEGVEFSNVSYETVLDKLKASGAQLHVAMLVDSEADSSQEERYRSIVIDRGTRETGGRRDNLLADMGVPGALEALAAELKGQFKVTYAHPDSLIQPEEVRITSARPELEVRGVAVPQKRASRPDR